jgi:hypothetical protein
MSAGPVMIEHHREHRPGGKKRFAFLVFAMVAMTGLVFMSLAV